MDELFKGQPEHVLAVKNRFKNLQRAAARKKFADDVAAAAEAAKGEK